MVLAVSIGEIAAESRNDFNIDQALIPEDEILSGGPPRDGIPAIDNPQFISANQAYVLQSSDAVLGIAYNGIVKAYPIKILNWHEIVNDAFNGEPIVVSFCPLCGSGMAHSAKIDGSTYTFGVSGLLYNSDVLFYDRQTESLWSQLKQQAISGAMKGERLKSLPVSHTTWLDWKTRHPKTLALSMETGYARDYGRSAYDNYANSRKLWFPVKQTNQRYHPKERVLGVDINGAIKAYPFVELGKTSGEFADTLTNQTVRVRFNKEHQTASIFDQQGHELPSVTTFWFAWYAFHPETGVFTLDP